MNRHRMTALTRHTARTLIAFVLTISSSWAQQNSASPQFASAAPGSAGPDQARARPYGNGIWSEAGVLSAMAGRAQNGALATPPLPRSASHSESASRAPAASAPLKASPSLDEGHVTDLPIGQSDAVLASDPVVRPEVTTTVTVSNHDVNRIACTGEVGDVFWSEERPVKISTADNNVFVKFQIQKLGDRYSFVSDPVDVHIVCDGQIYTIVLTPQATASVTVRLQPTVNGATKKLIHDWGALAVEDKVQRFTRDVYLGELPDGFIKRAVSESDPRKHLSVVDRSQPAATPVPGIQVTAQLDVVADGTGLRGTEYEIRSDQARELRETDFLIPAMGTEVGITIDPLRIPAGGTARLIVITRSVNHGS